MPKEKIVGFRVSEALHKKLSEIAIEKNSSISDVLREIVMDNLDMSYHFSQWEVHAWNLFNITADQLSYAKRAAKNAEQFFSIISKWAKDTKIRVVAHPEMVLIEFYYKDKTYVIQESKILTKMQIIQSIVDQFHDQIQSEVLREAESLCDGAVGGDFSSAGEKQLDELESGVQESIGGEGHSSVSDTDDL